MFAEKLSKYHTHALKLFNIQLPPPGLFSSRLPKSVEGLAAKLSLAAAFTLPVFSSHTLADVIVYEGLVFPEDVLPSELAWERLGTFDADRWIENESFYHFVELGVWAPPPGGEQDVYRRSIADFAGAQAFFIEWRVETDAPSSELDGIPVALNAFSNGAYYHFTITDELVRVIRHTTLPIVYVDIEPNVPHTYRLEFLWDKSYAWFIDGELFDSGLPFGPYPNDASGIIWGARYYLSEHTTKWDYIRYGNTPHDGSGDYNSDDQINSDDLYFFQECLSDTDAGSWPGCAWADMDFDGDTDCDDWFLFLEVWPDPADPPDMPECDCNPADLDCDGSVNAFDLALLLGSWGPCPDPPADCPADLNGDGEVNAFDLAILLGSWG